MRNAAGNGPLQTQTHLIYIRDSLYFGKKNSLSYFLRGHLGWFPKSNFLSKLEYGT